MVDFIFSRTGQIFCVLAAVVLIAAYIGLIVFDSKWGGNDRDNR